MTHALRDLSKQYNTAIIQQVEDRCRGYVWDMVSYTFLPRDTIGANLAFALLEPDFDFPCCVLNDEAIVELTNPAIDMISLCNVSGLDGVHLPTHCSPTYRMLTGVCNTEQSRGDDTHDMVACVMREHNTDIEGAMKVVESRFSTLTANFLDSRRTRA